MEDKDKNVVPRPGKSIWKKSNFKKETGERCKKNIRFNLNVDVLSDDGNHVSSPKQDGKTNNGEPSPKKRKKDSEMPTISNEVEREIEMQYYSKAKESKLTTRNVKSILKSVISNQYVVDMVRAVEEGGHSDLPFQPKLTRAKTKELLQQNPDAPIPPVVGLLGPAITSTSEMSPEIKLLIDKELSEDSSDEEYNPENEPEPSDDEEKGDTSLASDLDSLPPTPAAIQAPATPVHESSFDWSQDGIFKVPQENVGQRTRSKLDFHNLPLECIEQAYVPPDITPDMYEAECDNPDWHDFLKEFTQPLAPNETLDDDPENDPEYNIFEDDEKDPVDYKEEMRKDKAVKVSKKELNSLMKELFETDTLSSDEDEARTSQSIAELEASIMKETEDRQRREEEEKRKKQLGFHPNQRLLLDQQLRQHVQLTTQHFVQTYKHPVYHRHAETFKTMLVTLAGLKNDNVCCQHTHNLSAALDTLAEWKQTRDQPHTGEKIKQFVAEQIKTESALKKRKKKMVQQFPKEMMSVMMESEAFLYPMLLPPFPFLTSQKALGPNFFTSSEDMLLAICLEQVTQLMEDNKDMYKKRCLTDICRVISEICIPRSSPRTIAAHIRKLKASQTMNPVKAFFENGKPPIVCHYVFPVLQGKKLRQQPARLLPEVWRSYLAIAYKEKEEISNKESGKVSNTEGKSGACIESEKKNKTVCRKKSKEISRPQRKPIATKNETNTDMNQLGSRSKPVSEEGVVEVSHHKGSHKTTKKETINSAIQNINKVNKMSSKLCEKPKTTKKDINNMLARANSIQQAVWPNGQVYLNNEDLKKIENKPNNPIREKQKTDIKMSSRDKFKIKTGGKGSTNQKPIVKSSIQGSIKTKIDSVKLNKRGSVKKKAKTADGKSMKCNPTITAVPKMNFKVVSKGTTCYVKSEREEKHGGKPEKKSKIESRYRVYSNHTTNQKEYLNSLELLPNNVGGNQELCLPKACASNTPSTTTEANKYSDLGSQIPWSESDSHHSNSIESERTPLCVNIVNSCQSHSPRPPSTVKLKGNINLNSNLRLHSGKTIVPLLSVYSQLNGTS